MIYSCAGEQKDWTDDDTLLRTTVQQGKYKDGLLDKSPASALLEWASSENTCTINMPHRLCIHIKFLGMECESKRK